MMRTEPLVLALDVGGTKTAVAAVRGMPVAGLEAAGGPLTFPTPRDPEQFLTKLVEVARRVLPVRPRLAAIGIGVPGPLDAERGVVETSPNIGWRDLPIAELVSQRFGGIPVAIDDDSNTGALGEAIAGAGRGSDPFAYLPLGTGLGAGIVVGGHIVRGAHGAAGEVGHLAVDERVGPRCGCGRRNCVEAWCGGAGLARRAREVWPARWLGDGSPAPRDAAAVFALAGTGDPAALALVAGARHALAVAVAAILAAVDPGAVTIGGSIGRAQPTFVHAAFNEATRLVHRTAASRVRLRAPELGDASVIGGAAVLAVRTAGTSSR